MNDLKGFIHKQLDLSYSFDSNETNAKSERTKFRNIAQQLVTEILIENQVIPREITMESLFPGTWENTYYTKKGPLKEEFQIKEGNQYIYKDTYWFNISNVKIKNKNTLTFTKEGLQKNNDHRFFNNNLKIIEYYKHYEGKEEDAAGNTYKIIYKRVS